MARVATARLLVTDLHGKAIAEIACLAKDLRAESEVDQPTQRAIGLLLRFVILLDSIIYQRITSVCGDLKAPLMLAIIQLCRGGFHTKASQHPVTQTCKNLRNIGIS